MTEQDRGPFAELMLGIGEFYNETVSDVRMEMFFRALADLLIEDIRAAAQIHLNTSRFFPKPVELREAIEGTPEDQAELAWQTVQHFVRRYGFYHTGHIPWPDVATERAAMELYGGWKALCEHLPASGPEMLGTAKLFKASYAAYARRDLRESLALPSRDEAKHLLDSLTRGVALRGES